MDDRTDQRRGSLKRRHSLLRSDRFGLLLAIHIRDTTPGLRFNPFHPAASSLMVWRITRLLHLASFLEAARSRAAVAVS